MWKFSFLPVFNVHIIQRILEESKRKTICLLVSQDFLSTTDLPKTVKWQFVIKNKKYVIC